MAPVNDLAQSNEFALDAGRKNMDSFMTLTTPKAIPSPKTVSHHGISVTDPYSALRDKKLPDRE